MSDPARVILDLARPPFEARGERSIWQQIADRVAAACTDGRLLDRLPGENHMAQAFGVTRVTMRRALTSLQQQGLLQARKGVGVFVRSVPLKYRVDHGRHFADGLDGEAEIGTQTLTRSCGPASADESSALNIRLDAAVIRLSRLRLIDGAPVHYSEKALPVAPFVGFDTAYAARQSIMDVYLAHGIREYRRTETRVSGGFATAREAEILRLTPGTPVLRSTAINVAVPGGAPIEFSRGTWPLTAVELILNDTRKRTDE